MAALIVGSTMGTASQIQFYTILELIGSDRARYASPVAFYRFPVLVATYEARCSLCAGRHLDTSLAISVWFRSLVFSLQLSVL